MLSERLLITRIITSLGLALLLTLGLAATAQVQATAAAPVALVVTGLADPHVAPVTTDAVQEAVAGDPAGQNMLVGAALCVLGVLCGLTLIAALRGSSRRHLLPALGVAPRLRSPARAPTNRLGRTGLSLTRLGLSRT